MSAPASTPKATAQAATPETAYIEVTPRQMTMIENPATVLWIGAGTKTGKTVGLEIWIAMGIIAGDRCCWIGSYKEKTREAYEHIKDLLKPAEAVGDVEFNDSTRTIKGRLGGMFATYVGKEAQAIFGGGFHRVVIDEASRQKELSLTAALTTISATKGKVRLAFNLEHGAKNWAVKGLLRAKGMSDEERRFEGEDFMTMPTMDEGLVSAEFVAKMQRRMPKAMYEALYLAIIPQSDVALFRNLDEMFAGSAPTGPDSGHTYVMGVDLARKKNWTVATVLDVTTSRFVAKERFHEISWTVQYERLAALANRWRVCRTLYDQTGIGDPVGEELEHRGMTIEGFIFTAKSRKDLVEQFVIACDGKEWSAPENEEFEQHKDELQAFEYVLDDEGNVNYSAPENMPDDAAFSMMLAWWMKKQGNFGPPRMEMLRRERYAEEGKRENARDKRAPRIYSSRDFRGL
jgi:hypothetical protein